MSLVVLIKGAEATAGSIFSFFKTIGTSVPKVAAVSILHTKAMPMIIPIVMLPCHKYAAQATNEPTVTPNEMPMLASLKTVNITRLPLMLPVAIPRTVTVED